MPREKKAKGKKHAKLKSTKTTSALTKSKSRKNKISKQQDKITKIVILLIFTIVAGKLILSFFKTVQNPVKSSNSHLPDTLYLTKSDNGYGILENDSPSSLILHTGPPGIASLTPELAAETLPGALNPYRANSFIKIDNTNLEKLDYGFSLVNKTDIESEIIFSQAGDPIYKEFLNSDQQFDQNDSIEARANDRIESGKNAYWKKKRLTDNQTDFNSVFAQLLQFKTNADPWKICPSDQTTPVLSQKLKPVHQLDPEKYITGTLIWGPNNQIRGLRELIFLAIKLDRTLVIPPFFKHYAMDGSAEEKSSVIDPKYRIDQVELSKFVSVEFDMDKFEDVCAKTKSERFKEFSEFTENDASIGGFGALFLGRPDICHADKLERIDAVTDFFNFSPVKFESHGVYPSETFYCINQTNPVYPENIRDHVPNVKKQLLIPFEKQKIKDMFNSDETCVLSLFIYKSFNLKSVLFDDEEVLKRRQPGSGGGFYQVENFEDNELMQSIIRSTVRPDFVKTSVLEFLDKIAKTRNFVAVHWRYSASKNFDRRQNLFFLSRLALARVDFFFVFERTVQQR